MLLSHCRFSTAGAPPSLGQPSSEEGSYCNHTQPRYPSTGFQLAISPHTHKDRRKQAKPQLERKETLSSSYPLTVKSNHFPRRQAATQPVWFLAVLPLSPPPRYSRIHQQPHPPFLSTSPSGPQGTRKKLVFSKHLRETPVLDEHGCVRGHGFIPSHLMSTVIIK